MSENHANRTEKWPPEFRSQAQRLEDLEHDNNVLRNTLADIQVENVRLSGEWQAMARQIKILCSTVDDFVGRFVGRVQ